MLRRIVAMAALALAVGACGSPEKEAADAVDVAVSRAVPLKAETELDALLRHAIAEYVPELADYTIELAAFDSDADYFRSDIKPLTALRSGKKRTYRVLYNRNLFADPPPTAAVEAILVHELKHVLDYTRKTSVGYIFWGIGYVLCSDNSKYERATDLLPLERGVGEGLKQYRFWLYDRVSDEVEAQKRKTYFTPEEIDAFLAGQRATTEAPDAAEGHEMPIGD